MLRWDGYPLRSQHIKKILQRIGKKAGISQRLSPHKLRHTYATLAHKYGNNLEYVKMTLGHNDIKTTSQLYIAITDRDIAVAYRGFSPVNNIMIPNGNHSLPAKSKHQQCGIYWNQKAT